MAGMLGVGGKIINGQYFKGGSRLMWRVIYWLLTGALLGVGFIAILSIGSLFVLLGVLLVVLGALRVGARGIWAALLVLALPRRAS